MSVTRFRGAVEWALMVAMVAGSGVMAQANDEKAPAEGRVVRIGPEDQKDLPALPAPAEEGQVTLPGLPGGGRQVEMPKYWIGLLGGPISPELRAFLDIPENQGVMIREVVPDSPAAKSGLKKYDLVLRANDTLLNDMRDMVEIVRTEGDKHGQITLEVLRKGGRESVTVTPEDRPEQLSQSGIGGSGGGAIAGQELPPGAMQFFQNFGGGEGGQGLAGGQFGPEGPMEFRNFGPGVVVQPGPGGVANIPSGVSVSISKQEGQPAQVTVKRGEESWEVVGDDAKSLEKLPADLQPYVTGLLHGQGQTNQLMPRFGGRMGGLGRGGDNGIQDRLEAMEKQMQELQKQLLSPENTPADKSK